MSRVSERSLLLPKLADKLGTHAMLSKHHMLCCTACQLTSACKYDAHAKHEATQSIVTIFCNFARNCRFHNFLRRQRGFEGGTAFVSARNLM